MHESALVGGTQKWTNTDNWIHCDADDGFVPIVTVELLVIHLKLPLPLGNSVRVPFVKSFAPYR